MLLVTGSMLIWVSRQEKGERVYQSLTVGQALLIGLSQAGAILPGISRSGATISMQGCDWVWRRRKRRPFLS
jgi:undecaprenyl-diphosphatase